ncbi:hypothetical protein AL036_13020 [Salipiger aestuarii]|uniref:hypothetical protein n=1 Tax=Salipiger aestuarii TaxID=568098 RepID=UPI00025B7C9A|nr:hypothetical protein [Salipiger aestuarii]EIE53037.1 hypothetical protein C357_00244 [Citreicella sp. 357]KAA8606861.1 hypothetical protein AL036_13020 [Salipiger aestuarii]KAA8607978.1 hypothetical protein AL037_17845 [Salipiger aestuarii]KAB2536230.1 hypothetical protein AL035_20000 [Salipiger aestuarii]
MYLAAMSSRARHIVITLFAVLLLAVGSIASARMMAPDENTIIRAEVAALGLSLDDICGDHLGHEHRCPFCHLTPDTPLPAPVGIWRVFIPSAGWKESAALYREAQARDHCHAPRAPPEMI